LGVGGEARIHEGAPDTMTMPEGELGRFAAVVELLLGFRFEPGRAGEFAAALDERVSELGVSCASEYLDLALTPGAREAEAAALARRLTVGETYFFREAEHHRVLTSLMLHGNTEGQAGLQPRPEWASPERPRVLSVGCSSGEEPYGLAISMVEAGLKARGDDIQAFDANPDAIERARAGEYASWALRALPVELRDRYFSPCGRGRYRLSEEIRGMVSFDVRNLLDDDPTFWLDGGLDAVFCRNVLIYFSAPLVALVHERLGRALRRGGVLFLGHSEMLSSRHGELETQRALGAFFHVRRASPAAAAAQGGRPAS
jgi:chemotaxis protein methyltransferase CheR